MEKKTVPDPLDRTKQVAGVRVKVVEATEPFSYIKLEDGTEITIRNTVIEILRLEDRWDPQGNPIYNVTSQGTLTVDVPADLRKPPHVEFRGV